MHGSHTTEQPRTTPAGRRSKWQLGLLAAVAAVTLSPMAALAAGDAAPQQVDDGGYVSQVGQAPVPPGDGDYVTTTIPARSIDVSGFSPACSLDAPTVTYSITTTGFTPVPPNATLVIRAKNGSVIETKTVNSLSGSFIWPGASVDGSGNATDWPGWKRADDGVSWIPDSSDAYLRDGLIIDVTVTDDGDAVSARATVSYPPVTSPCANPPGQSLDVSGFSPACIAGAPFIQYAIKPINFTSSGPATLTFYDRNGTFVSSQVVNSLSGRVIYPGASVDGNGTPTDWPGWKIADDGTSWIPDASDAFLREGLTIKVEVGASSATTTVGYVSADAPCANPPGGSPPTTTICTDGPNGDCTAPTTTVCTPGQNNDSNPSDDCTPPTCVPGQNNDSNPADDCSLARTGGSPNTTLILAAIALLGGLGFLGAARRRRQPGDAPGTD